MDLYTWEVVGWNVTTRHTSELVINAFFDAVKTLGKMPKIVHTDQGSEYNCKEYAFLLEKLGIQISMSGKGSPWENGHQESFFGHLKAEGGDLSRFETEGELLEELYRMIYYYNHQRIHTKLKMTPHQYRQNYLQNAIKSIY
jgi:transposase InsO family protein